MMMIIITTTTDSICNKTKGDSTGARIRYRKRVCWQTPYRTECHIWKWSSLKTEKTVWIDSNNNNNNNNNNNDDDDDVATLKSSEELVIIHEQYYVITNKMCALLVCFVRDGGCFRGRGRERERQTALGKIIANQYQLDSCSWLKNAQCNQTNITHSSTDFNTILIKLNYS